MTNSGTPDTSGPVATNINFSPRTGNVSDGPVTINATFQIADPRSGFDYGYLLVKNPSGESQPDLQVEINAATRVTGDAHSGTYQASIIIPKDAMNGSWTMNLSLRDKIGNPTVTPEVSINILGSSAVSGDLGDACDATQFDWTTQGNKDWFFQTARSHDGIDAARSGPIGPGQQSIMKLKVNGPGTLTFWWKVDSAQSNTLTVETQDPSAMRSINGTTSWLPVTLNIPSGSQTITWTFTRSFAGKSGEDAGWVDRVHFTGDKDREPPTIQYLSISPNLAPVTNRPVNVTLKFEVSDDFSGVTGGQARIIDPNGNDFSAPFDSSHRLPGGTKYFGTYQVVFPIAPSNMVANGGTYSFGTWNAEITVIDENAKTRTYGRNHTAFPVANTGKFTITNTSTGGEIAIASINSFTPDPVDVTSAAGTVMLDFTMEDPGYRFSHGTVLLHRPDGDLVDAYDFNFSAGSDNRYSIGLTIPKYGQPGSWRVAFSLVDFDNIETNVSGQIQYSNDDKFAVINTGVVDTAPPVVASIAITPGTVNSSAGPADIAITVALSDDLSGLKTVRLHLIDPSENEQEIVVDAAAVNGSFTVNHTLPQGSAEGVWRCEVSARDKAGNFRRYGTGSSDTPFPVPSNAEFVVESSAGSAFAAFTNRYSLSGNNALLGANPDHDWAPNALEFLLGLDPTVASTADPALYQVTRVGNALRLDFKPAADLVITTDGDFLVVSDAAGGSPIRVTGQTATDLAGPWVDTLPLSMGGGIYRVSISTEPNARGFCRLKFIEP